MPPVVTLVTPQGISCPISKFSPPNENLGLEVNFALAVFVPMGPITASCSGSLSKIAINWPFENVSGSSQLRK